jgi:hypothetical protein
MLISESIYFVAGVKDVFGINIEEAECAEDFFLLVGNARLLVRLVCVPCGRSWIRRYLGVVEDVAPMMTISGPRGDMFNEFFDPGELDS